MSESQKDPRCATCLAFHEHDDENGECRRYAPTSSPTQEAAYWPVVAVSDWCLQHRKDKAPFDLTFIPVDRVDNFGSGDA